MHKVNHYVVTRSDNVRDSAGAVLDKLLSIAEPNVRAMRQTRYLQKIGKALWLSVDKHLHRKARAEFGDTPCSALYTDIIGFKLYRLC